MSIKVQSFVWENSKSKGTALLVLLAIADHAHDNGDGAYPSIETLAAKCRQSERNVQRVIQKLQKIGEIVVRDQAGPHGCNVYQIPVPWGVILSGVTTRDEGVTNRAEIVPQMSPEPSLTIIEPERESDAKIASPRVSDAKALWDALPTASQGNAPVNPFRRFEAEWREMASNPYATIPKSLRLKIEGMAELDPTLELFGRAKSAFEIAVKSRRIPSVPILLVGEWEREIAAKKIRGARSESPTGMPHLPIHKVIH